eukprot:SAG11_NODE_2238_length_3640_cov_11.873239_1_plen_95_part_00
MTAYSAATRISLESSFCQLSGDLCVYMLYSGHGPSFLCSNSRTRKVKSVISIAGTYGKLVEFQIPVVTVKGTNSGLAAPAPKIDQISPDKYCAS